MIPGPLGMGGAPLGNLFDRIDEDVAAATVEAGWDAGVRHFDTAPHYGAGLSELRMGAVLRRKPREAYWISSKIGRRLTPIGAVPDPDQGFYGALPFHRHVDYSAGGTVRSIEDSLARMGLNRLDIVYIHDVSEDWHGAEWTLRFREAMAGAAKVLSAMRKRGEIKAWGLGVNMVEPCLAALEQADPDVFLVAGRYTLIDHTALGKLLPACEKRGVKLVLGGPYNSGLLAGGTTFNYETAPADLAAKAQAIGAICARHGVDLKAAALQFCAAHPAVATVIPGARTPAEVKQNAAMMAAPIPGGLWADLRRAGLLPDEAPTPERRNTHAG